VIEGKHHRSVLILQVHPISSRTGTTDITIAASSATLPSSSSMSLSARNAVSPPPPHHSQHPRSKQSYYYRECPNRAPEINAGNVKGGGTRRSRAGASALEVHAATLSQRSTAIRRTSEKYAFSIHRPSKELKKVGSARAHRTQPGSKFRPFKGARRTPGGGARGRTERCLSGGDGSRVAYGLQRHTLEMRILPARKSGDTARWGRNQMEGSI